MIQFPALLWDKDPGYFRLKQAIKTVIAILMTLFLVRNEPLFGKLMASLACGFSMQGVNAKKLSWRIAQVICFDVVYFLCFMLGLVVRDAPNLTAVILVILGFTVNYLRQYGLQNSMAPMMAWVLCFFATILPANSSHEVWLHLYALIIGLVVSAAVSIFIFPENYNQLFVDNTNRLLQLLSRGMSEMRYFLVRRPERQGFAKSSLVQLKENLNYLLDSNQMIAQADIFAERQAYISEILLHQYALVSAYAMMVEAYHVIKIHDYQLPRSIRLALVIINRRFALWFATLRMYPDFSFDVSSPNIDLQELSESIIHDHLTDPSLVMALLNLKLTFSLINQHMAKMEKAIVWQLKKQPK